MAGTKTLNDPTTQLDMTTVEFVNTGSATITDGEIVIKDFATMATDTAASTWVCGESGKIVASNPVGTPNQDILGVCRDRSGAGVAVGAVGLCIVRGFHPNVLCDSAYDTAVGSILVNSVTAGKAHVFSAGTTVNTGAKIGNALKIRAKTSVPVRIPAFIDVG